MEMLSNGYGCIRKCSKTIKQSLFDWILPKFYKLLFKTMSDTPTASTSAASTSSESPASTSRINLNPCTFRCNYVQDIDYTTTEESDISSDEESQPTDDGSHSSNEVEQLSEDSEDTMDNRSWSSAASSTATHGMKTSSDNSEPELLIIKDNVSDEKPFIKDDIVDDTTGPLVLMVQLNGMGIDLVNVEEHAKRLKELEKELEYIESTEWMYRPIDAAIK